MNPAAKFILRDKIKERFPTLTDDITYELLSELDKLGALKNDWDETGMNLKENEVKTSKELPKSFNMVSPMWSGNVFLVEREGFICYQDSENNVRLHSGSEKDMFKKILKYRK